MVCPARHSTTVLLLLLVQGLPVCVDAGGHNAMLSQGSATPTTTEQITGEGLHSLHTQQDAGLLHDTPYLCMLPCLPVWREELRMVSRVVVGGKNQGWCCFSVCCVWPLWVRGQPHKQRLTTAPHNW